MPAPKIGQVIRIVYHQLDFFPRFTNRGGFVIPFLVPVVRILIFLPAGRDRPFSLLRVMGSQAQQHRQLTILGLVPEKDSGSVVWNLVRRMMKTMVFHEIAPLPLSGHPFFFPIMLKEYATMSTRSKTSRVLSCCSSLHSVRLRMGITSLFILMKKCFISLARTSPCLNQEMQRIS